MNQHVVTHVCRTCKGEKPLTDFWKQASTKSGYQSECKDCMRARNNLWHRDNQEKNNQIKARIRSEHPLWHIFYGARQRARKRRVPFTITFDEITWPTHCPILGIELKTYFGQRRACGPRWDSFSLDRIKPELGYVPGNVIVVSMRANRIKSDATIEELQKIARFYAQIPE